MDTGNCATQQEATRTGRNNQSAQSNTSRRNTAGISHNSHKDLKCRDTTLVELQSMFSTSVDPEVVQLILTESHYNVDDAIERLLVLSDVDQDRNKGQLFQTPDVLSQSIDLPTFSSSLPGVKREKSPLSVEEKRATALSCEQDLDCFGTSKSATMVSINSATSSPVKTESLHVSPFVLSFGNPAAFTEFTMENSVEQTTEKSEFGEKGRNCSQAQNPLIYTPSLFAVLNPEISQVVQSNAPTKLHSDGRNTLIAESSDLPEFPDTISQQYKELRKENQGHIDVENITSQELSNTDNYNSSEIANSFTGQNGFSLPSLRTRGPGEIKWEQCHEFKENLENVIKQGTTNGLVSENWSSTGGTDSIKQSWLYVEAGRNKRLSPSTSVVNRAYSTQQLQNRPRTSSNYLPSGMSSQSLSYAASGQNSQKMFPVHDLGGFNCSTGNGSQNLVPHQNISPPYNLLSKGPIFHPPAVQRRCQPPMNQGRGYLRQDTSTLQPRWRFRPSFQTPWQQALNIVPWPGPRATGNAPHRYPHRSSQKPYLQFGRGRPPGPHRFPTNASPFTTGFMPIKHERLLILMRGLPGSGKSTLAQKLKGVRGIVLSTDDFFMKNQRYDFDGALLGEAHEWNQKRARKALEDQISPIIIDNTNSQTWEMKPYVSMAVRHSYHVKFVEPDVSWKWNIRELARRNHHGVDINSIRKMKERYEHNVTVDKVINSERKVNNNTGLCESDTVKEAGSNQLQFGEQEMETSQVKMTAPSENRIAEPKLNVHEAVQGADKNNMFVVEENEKGLISAETELNDSMHSTRQGVSNQDHGQYPSPKPQRVRKARDTRSRYIHQNMTVECETTHKEKCRETGERGDTVSGAFVESEIESPELLRCSSSSESRQYSLPLCQDRMAWTSCDSHLAECCQSDSCCLHNGRVDAEYCLEADSRVNGKEASLQKTSSCNVQLSPCLKTNTSVPLPGFENDSKKASDDCEDNAVEQRDPSENLCVLESKSFPPPLSFILATAARSKRGLSSSFGVQKQSTTTAEADERCEYQGIATEACGKLTMEAVGVEEFTQPPIAVEEGEVHIEHHNLDIRADRRCQLRVAAIDPGGHEEYVVENTEAEDEREYQTPAQGENGDIELSASHIEIEVYDDRLATVSEAMKECEQTSAKVGIKRPVLSIETDVREDNSVSLSGAEISAKETVGHMELPASAVEKEVHEGHTTTVSEAEEQFDHEDLAIYMYGDGDTCVPATDLGSDVQEDHTTAILEEKEHCEQLVSVKWATRHADLPASPIESDVYEDHTTAISEAEEHPEHLVSAKWMNRHACLPTEAVKAYTHEDAAVPEAEEQCDHQTSAEGIEEHNSEFPTTNTEARDPSDQMQFKQRLEENGFYLVEEAAVNCETMKENKFVVSSPQSDSGSLENVMSGLEFLVACFPDLGRDNLNILLSINNGNVIKVVDDLVSSVNDLDGDCQPSVHTQGSPVPGDTLGFPTQENPLFGSPPQINAASAGQIQQAEADTFSVGSTQALPSFQAAFLDQRQEKEHGAVRGSNASVEYCDSRQVTSEVEVNSSLIQPQLCSVSDTGTFQLTLEPAVAFHLIEMFGPIAGLNLGEDIDHQDLIIDVDSNFARQLYKKWEKAVQVRKGISTSKVGSGYFGSPRSRILRIGNDTRDSRAVVQSGIKKMTSPFRSPEQQTGTLREIMDEQLALELSRSENLPDASEQDMATTLKRQKLYAMFPGVDPQALDEVFDVNRHELGPTVEAVKASCNLPAQQIPRDVFARESSKQDAAYDDLSSQETAEDWSWLDSLDPFKPNSWKDSFQALEAPKYSDYRAETLQHAKQRNECFKKAALAFSRKQGQLAHFYAQQGHLHTEKIKEANARAAALILDRKNEKLDDNTIDLHGLHVSEAIEALEKLLNEKKDPSGIQSRKGCKFLSVVTGRGSHSRGGKARIRPAVLEYLKKYNYRFTEPQPGLVKVFL